MALGYRSEAIKLQDAFAEPIENHISVWEIEGLHVNHEFPDNAKDIKTFVLKPFDDNFSLGVQATIGLETTMGQIDEFSSLEELKKQYPHLFGLIGKFFFFPAHN